MQDDETNTNNAFSAIDNLLVKRVKKESPADYWYIRNDLITYFRNEPDFLFDQLVERIENHNVVSSKFEVVKDKFIEELKALPDLPKSKFDRQFTLVPKIIRRKIKKTILLDENFELKINGEINDFRNKIFSESDNRGKYIKIYSDNGYDQFSASDDTEEQNA